jgi:DNA-binding winged helix-turn-helix (wHTH) protein
MNEPFTRAATAAHIDLAHEPDFALGRLRVRPSLREIVCDGRHETIDRRVMQVLVVLARADGGVVSRDDLIASCWESVVVGEDAITNCIVRLRKAAEATNNAFAIETVPRVGYRLKVAEVAVVAVLEPQAQTAAPVAIAASPPIPTPEKSKWTPRTNWIAAFLVLAILAVIAAVFAFWRYWPKAAQIAAAPVEASVAVLPFVNMSGDPKQEYFSDGFSEELVNDLSNEPHLRVASRTSSFAFKGRNQDI